MKTSNKLLIAFALALLLIPILGIAIVSGVYYEKDDQSAMQKGAMDTFGVIPENVASIPVNSPFKSVTIDGGNQLHLVVKLVKDEKSGVKFPDDMKGLITALVDGNGQLQIVVKATGKKHDNYTRIAVYGPDIKELNVLNGKGINLNANTDSLALNLSHTGSAHFDPDTKIGKLNIRTADVQQISFRETGTKSVILNLKNTNVKSDMSSFDQLSIYAAGTSEIELNGGYGEKTDKVIKHLTLNTLGKAKVKVYNMKIDQCAGRFSDSTSVEMPAVNINQMYR
ncbi:hypothetical protein [Pedobacter heparinus]|uniref:Uncharacterized protein n=1 Tax=Pedobacter heparinus (strain ATCC 13125 / DSM 2366 / CIP 104194 / JCM 7457 / NBRC 12017 / NCIMB 9290 / NRRL B-14731 / HIM 762-3) TaxID=485917 RepID=C6XSI2_PEDHD|nr:hypothetical protein [Pedobacter heparinus]ACU05545.1 hypothetical protein Phep_3351 [Pedobacter heparinus DSM 2366]